MLKPPAALFSTRFSKHWQPGTTLKPKIERVSSERSDQPKRKDLQILTEFATNSLARPAYSDGHPQLKPSVSLYSLLFMNRQSKIINI